MTLASPLKRPPAFPAGESNVLLGLDPPPRPTPRGINHLELEPRQVYDLARGLECGQGDRQILDREPRRIERRDLPGIAPALRSSHQDLTKRGHILLADEPLLDCVRELAAVARLLAAVYICNTY